MAKPGISRRFSVKNFREKIRAETAGQTDSRQQAPPAKPPRKARRKTPAGAGENRRERMPVAGPAPMAGIMQGGGDGLQNGRAEGFYARGIRSIPGLFTTPPIVPPSPMQEPNAIPAKSTASTTSTAGRQPAPASTGHQHHQRRGKSHTAQNHQHQQTAHTTAPQPAPAHATASQHHTRPGRSARRRRRPARRSPPAQPGGRRYSRRGL